MIRRCLSNVNQARMSVEKKFPPVIGDHFKKVTHQLRLRAKEKYDNYD